MNVKVKVSGTKVEDLHLEIIQGKEVRSYIRLFHFLPIFSGKVNDENWKSMRYLNKILIPDNVDQNLINANFNEEEKILTIDLPYGGYKLGLGKL